MNRTLSRLGRSLLQVIAAGGLTAVVDAIAKLTPRYETLLGALNFLLVVTVQNLLESAGKVPTVFEDAHARKAP